MHLITPCSFDVRDIVEFAERDETAKPLMHQLKGYHPYTYWHSIRVAHYAMKLATKCAYNAPEQLALLRSTLLHDIGKLHIPLAVLNKKGALSNEEWPLLHIHPLVGNCILESASDWIDLDVVCRHHENLDGSGYPHGLTAHQLTLSVRITRVVDSFDAMTSSRGYDRVMTGREAIAELFKWVGKNFDYEVVEMFQEYYLANIPEMDAVGKLAQ